MTAAPRHNVSLPTAPLPSPAAAVDFSRPEQVEQYAHTLIDTFQSIGGFEALTFTPEQLTLRSYAAEWLTGVRLYAPTAAAESLPQLFSWLDWMALIAGDTTGVATTLPDRHNPRLLAKVRADEAPCDEATEAYLLRWLDRTRQRRQS